MIRVCALRNLYLSILKLNEAIINYGNVSGYKINQGKSIVMGIHVCLNL